MMVSISKTSFPGRSPSRRRSGAEILEAALVLPIVLSLIFGMVEFGYFFHVQHTVQAAAREAARTACVANATEGTTANATSRCNQILSSAGLSPANLTLTFSPSPESALPGDNITVNLQTTWGQVGVRLFGLIGDSKVIRSSVVFRKEG
jgi:Flp pilus assembly protein TadG